MYKRQDVYTRFTHCSVEQESDFFVGGNVEAGAIPSGSDIRQSSDVYKRQISYRAALRGDFITDTPHHYTGIVTIVVQHIHHIAVSYTHLDVYKRQL